MKHFYSLIFSLLLLNASFAQNKLFINMDIAQTDHLKAYGITYHALEKGYKADWLLNFRGGSFMIDFSDDIALECRIAGVYYSELTPVEVADIYSLVQSESENMEVIRLEKAPKVAVFVPPGFQPWDDAVTIALEYAGIPYEKIWNEQIINGDLSKYDWLHLHHEDFTGQYGKFYASYANAQWYIEQQIRYENDARRLGFRKVSELMRSVSLTIKEYIGNGGFLFAMCSATDSYDISLAAHNTDICDRMFDGDPPEPGAQTKLDFSFSLAFEDFALEMNPMIYEYSDIDIQPMEVGSQENDYFSLFEFSAKYDPVPTMLTQNHVNVIKGFMGQTTSFRKNLIKKSVVILGEREGLDQVKYIHGNYGRGTFTFYGGHDPEDYQHLVGDPPTELNIYKNSPGYRLILNNILFPAAKKKKQKT